MKNNRIARLLAALSCGFGFGLYMIHDYGKWRGLGKVAFLDHEGHRFDEAIANAHPAIFDVFGAIFAVGVFLIIYELIALGLARLLQRGETAPAQNHSLAQSIR